MVLAQCFLLTKGNFCRASITDEPYKTIIPGA